SRITWWTGPSRRLSLAIESPFVALTCGDCSLCAASCRTLGAVCNPCGLLLRSQRRPILHNTDLTLSTTDCAVVPCHRQAWHLCSPGSAAHDVEEQCQRAFVLAIPSIAHHNISMYG